MRNSTILFMLFLTIQIQAQNWIGNINFIDLYEQSDIVIIGVISNIEKVKHKTSKNSFFSAPLKSMTLTSIVNIKGDTNKNKVYYTAIYTGCGNTPILYENIINKKTLIFGKIKNDSIFQIGSMNESPVQIAKAAIEFENIKSAINTENFTNWFSQAAQNKDVFKLLNNMIALEKEPIYSLLNNLNFSIEQRNKLYDVLDSFNNYEADNEEEIISILVKYKDKRLKAILKKYIIELREEPYSSIDSLMNFYSMITENTELQLLINKFKNDYRVKNREKLINKFINKI